MDRRFFCCDATRVDESLHKGVIGCDLTQFAVAQEVDAGIADVREGELRPDPQDCADRRAHSGELLMIEHRLGEKRVGRHQRRLEGELSVLSRGIRLICLNDSFDGDSGGDVTPGVTTHTVGDDE